EPLRYSIEGQQEFVLERLLSEPRVRFSELCRSRSKAFIIATFLATLELARQQYLYVEIHSDDAIDFTLVQREEQPLIEDDPGVETPEGMDAGGFSAETGVKDRGESSDGPGGPGGPAVGGDGAMTG
ncbi:MAG TPA: hypothetical protein ACFCU0_05305, partial [Longibacter sp.]